MSIVVEEGNTAKADFVTYSLLEACLRENSKVVFVAAQHNFAHYSAVLKKMVGTRNLFLTLCQGINL